MLDFNGSADGLELTTAVATATPLTFAAFFISDSSTASQGLIHLGRTNRVDRFDLLVSGDVALDPVRAATTTNNVAVIGLSASGYSVGTLHHAAAVFASSTSRTAYLDGVPGTTNTGLSTPLSINRTNIGVRQNGAGGRVGFFDGRIGEAAIWQAALTTAEIVALASGCSPLRIRPELLLAYCDIVRDGRNFKGTAFSNVGSPAAAAHAPRIYRPHGFYTAPSATQAYTLAAESGSYALTGSAATLKAARMMAAASGAYALTGSAATLKRAFTMPAASGAYALTGSGADLRVTRNMNAEAGSYALTGSPAALRAARRLAAESGAYVLTGSPTDLIFEGGADDGQLLRELQLLCIGRTVHQLSGLSIWKSKRKPHH